MAVDVQQPAPDFTATGANGQPIQLSAFKGKVVVLEWTNHDCPFVKKHYESGNIPKLQKEAAAQGVVPFDEAAALAAARNEPPVTIYDSTGKIVDMAKAFSAKYGLKATGVATLLVEQRVESVLQMADRVAFMDHGRVAEVVAAAGLRADAPQFAAYVGV